MNGMMNERAFGVRWSVVGGSVFGVRWSVVGGSVFGGSVQLYVVV
jgi:hypothetical protein